MAEEGGFLQRWSRRKRATGSSPSGAADSAEPGSAGRGAVEAEGDVPVAEPPAAVDPSTLPSLDSIGAGGDIKAFLQQGVPPDLRRTALRRLWSANARIRDFREVADYDWDFNAPGYGALLPGDDPRALAARLLTSTRRLTGGGPEPTVNSTLPSRLANDAKARPGVAATEPTLNSTLQTAVQERCDRPAVAGEQEPTADSTFDDGDVDDVANAGGRGGADDGPPFADAAPTVNSTYGGTGGDRGRVRLTGVAHGGGFVGGGVRAGAGGSCEPETLAEVEAVEVEIGVGMEAEVGTGQSAEEKAVQAYDGGVKTGARRRRHGGAMPR